MIYAVISDIHSNLESLTEFLKLMKKNKIEKIAILGDIVGYNANPNECIAIISSMNNAKIIRGNHDRAVATNDYANFSSDAIKSIQWTINKCNYSSMNFLKNIQIGPMIISETSDDIGDSFAICHGSALDEDKYMLFPLQTKKDFAWLKTKNINLLFTGHTHIPTIFMQNNNLKISKLSDQKLLLTKNNSYIINPGSLGQPRNRDKRASFIIYDSEEKSIQFIKYRYKFKITQRKILNEKLPKFLSERLSYGR